MSAPDLTPVSDLLAEGARAAVFPGAQACVFLRGEQVFAGHAGTADAATRFDLASLTKVLGTTSLFLSLWGEGKVGPETKLSRFFDPEHSPAARSNILLSDLLYHRSGLPAFVPYFARVMPAVPELFDPACPASTRAEVRDSVIEGAAKAGLRYEARAEALYSDVGFILLGEALARATQTPLDMLFEQRIAKPLGLDLGYRRLSLNFAVTPDLAPTGRGRPREPAPGQETMWPPIAPQDTRAGEVDDDNAWVMDGVAGHAGLFGSAREVARLGQVVLEELGGAGKLAPAPLWARAIARDTLTPKSTRALGWDTPSAQGSTAGSLFARTSIGHTGFTGTSLWIDPTRGLVVALCTNRTWLGRDNVKIRDFRPRFHDAVVTALAL